MARPSWFRHEPDRTATGYRWLDLLTAPYWRVVDWRNQRWWWQVMAVGDETWREARNRTQQYFRDHPELLDDAG